MTAGLASEWQSLLPLEEQKPKSNALAGRSGPIHILRGQFSIITWLCIGGVLQGALTMSFGHLAILPMLAFLIYGCLTTAAMLAGLKRNTSADGSIQKKVTAQFPDTKGNFSDKPAGQGIVVFILGTRCNHPLGALAPGFATLSKYFRRNVEALDSQADEFGFLGMTSWTNISDRSTNAELMQVSYFRTTEGLLRFAHSTTHREGWTWWSRIVKQYPHLSIYHETYEVPAGCWETVYINSNITGLASSAHKVVDEKTGEVRWARPIVDASRTSLRTSLSRMGRASGLENDEHFGNASHEAQPL